MKLLLEDSKALPAFINKDSKQTKKRQIYGDFSKGAQRKSQFKTKKSKSGPGDYKHVEAFYKTQEKTRYCVFSKGKIFYIVLNHLS